MEASRGVKIVADVAIADVAEQDFDLIAIPVNILTFSFS